MSTDTLPSDPKLLMRSIIQRIATGPDLSKDISRTEAHLGTKAIIDNVIDPVQVGIYFIALRMKRETMDENRGVLDAVLETTQRVTADVDEVVDIGDPYDGYNRCLPAAPFLGPLLAEFGVHVVSHGLDKVGPKYGVTARHVLEAAGVPVNLSPAEAAARLADPALGWTYVDQAQSNPGLHNLIPLRAQMIKRQVLTTVEVLSKPIAGQKLTHFVTGYVHKPYPPVYADLAREAGFDTACIVRGVEGGVIPSACARPASISTTTTRARKSKPASIRWRWGSTSRCARCRCPAAWRPRKARTKSSRRSTSRPPRMPRPRPASWR